MIRVTRRAIEPKLSDAAVFGIKEILFNYLASRSPHDGVMQDELREVEAKIYALLLRDGRSHLFPYLEFDEESEETVLQLTFDEGFLEETE